MVVTSIANAPGLRRRAPRLAGDARRAQIIEAACQFFAVNGFSGPTRDLAASIGVTQALLYRYFDSKAALIDAVFAEVFRDHWGVGAVERFETTAGRPMVERVADTYEHMLPRMTKTAIQLLFRAGLDDFAQPIYNSAGKSWPVWLAILEAWRAEEGLSPIAVSPLMEGERIMMIAMHNAMVMIRVRQHIFHVPLVLDDADEIHQVAEVQDAGARVVLRNLHSGKASANRMKPLDAGAVEAA